MYLNPPRSLTNYIGVIQDLYIRSLSVVSGILDAKLRACGVLGVPVAQSMKYIVFGWPATPRHVSSVCACRATQWRSSGVGCLAVLRWADGHPQLALRAVWVQFPYHPRSSPSFMEDTSRQSLLRELSTAVGQGCRKSVICAFSLPSQPPPPLPTHHHPLLVEAPRLLHGWLQWPYQARP